MARRVAFVGQSSDCPPFLAQIGEDRSETRESPSGRRRKLQRQAPVKFSIVRELLRWGRHVHVAQQGSRSSAGVPLSKRLPSLPNCVMLVPVGRIILGSRSVLLKALTKFLCSSDRRPAATRCQTYPTFQ
jgi:hypothetical protein